MNPQCITKLQNCIGSSRYSVNTKLPGAVFIFQMLLNVIWKNVVIRHRLDLIEHPTTFACRLHILSRPGGCQSLMTEVYYILPNKVTKLMKPPRSCRGRPWLKTRFSYRRSLYLAWLSWNSVSRSNSESWNHFCAKNHFLRWKPSLILNSSVKSKNVITFDSGWFKSWSFEGWKIRAYIVS